MSGHNNEKAESMETVVARIDENVKSLVFSRGDHEARLRRLEQWQWRIMGAGGLITIAIAAYEAIRH